MPKRDQGLQRADPGAAAAHRADRPAAIAAVAHPRRRRPAGRGHRRPARRSTPPTRCSAATSCRGSTWTCARPRAGPTARAAASTCSSSGPLHHHTRRSRPTRPAMSIAALIEQVPRLPRPQGRAAAPSCSRVINGNTRQLAGQFETSAAVLGALRSNALYRRPDNYWETIADRYRGMTAPVARPGGAPGDRSRTISSGSWSATPPRSARSSSGLGLPIEECAADVAVRPPGESRELSGIRCDG